MADHHASIGVRQQEQGATSEEQEAAEGEHRPELWTLGNEQGRPHKRAFASYSQQQDFLCSALAKQAVCMHKGTDNKTTSFMLRRRQGACQKHDPQSGALHERLKR